MVTISVDDNLDLHRRAADAGGSCTLERPEGGGTRLIWAAPLPWALAHLDGEQATAGPRS